MVVLDAVLQIQAEQASDLAVRWNCKAGKCGSCSAEVNGRPRLMCMTRMNQRPAGETVTVEPRPPDAADGTWRIAREDVDRVQEFRKCIECFLCQDVCHVLRDHRLHDRFNL
jgi:succinate dehydrogenase / fumarate reductase iron-sulfur subunit